MLKSKYPREVFNEIKWRFDLSRCSFYYVHRGAPGDVKAGDGRDIKTIGRAFLTLKIPSNNLDQGIRNFQTLKVHEDREVHIPYHRIIKIIFDDKIVFERKKEP
jgi:uncharacterized protein (UPF0248 family)